MRRPADGNAHRIEPRLLYQTKIVGLKRDTPGSLLWPVQGVPEIDASAKQTIIMKGVVVLRECRHAGCRKQYDAEDTAGHLTDYRKNDGTDFVSTVCLESRQPPAIVPLEGHSEGSTRIAQLGHSSILAGDQVPKLMLPRIRRQCYDTDT
jgi:hypothetical protein